MRNRQVCSVNAVAAWVSALFLVVALAPQASAQGVDEEAVATIGGQTVSRAELLVEAELALENVALTRTRSDYGVSRKKIRVQSPIAGWSRPNLR